MNFYKITRTRKLEYTILFSILLFLFDVIFSSHDSIIIHIAHEIIVFLVITSLYIYLKDFLAIRTNSPFTLVVNSLILAALIFFILTLTNTFFNYSEINSNKISFPGSFSLLLIIFILIGAATFIFSGFRELFYFRQKKNLQMYFNTMLVFLALAYFSNLLIKFDDTFDYPKDAFFVVSIILISINSLRVAWIAFLSKKQKIYLLIISIILTTLFGVNFGLLIDSNAVKSVIYNFSPGLFSIFILTMIYGMIYSSVIFFTTLFHLPTAEEFDRKAEEVSSLFDLTKLITQVFDLSELADTITALTTKVCNSDFAWLVTAKNEKFVLNSVNNIEYNDAEKVTEFLLDEYSYDIVNVLTIKKSTIKIRDKDESKTLSFGAIAIAPLRVHGKLNGYLFTARKHEYNFDEEDIKAVGAFADYASVAVENAKHIKESLEKERLEKELDVAREIQYKILPRKIPNFKNLTISTVFVPAFEVGGDYYDFFELNDDCLGFVVADVSGKGISAAFIMSELKGIFESLANIIVTPKKLLTKANELLKNTLDKKNFVTAIYGIIDFKKEQLKFARAGHTPVLYFSENKLTKLKPQGIGLGLDYGHSFENTLSEVTIELKDNDIITFYSDGIPEAKNSKLEDFGYDRFVEILRENCNESPDYISSELMKQISMFSKDKSQHDDITLVLFKWKSNNKLNGDS
ncbi:SpoIIE family protein phosphatase [Melioribacteraceae bacterium 4301-Me]|uniref:SpoIIE family protein phosphatase n=1 Tax=Pyranulibacter aquaticus TaxID=3163344 RepID=UPI00359986A4